LVTALRHSPISPMKKETSGLKRVQMKDLRRKPLVKKSRHQIRRVAVQAARGPQPKGGGKDIGESSHKTKALRVQNDRKRISQHESRIQESKTKNIWIWKRNFLMNKRKMWVGGPGKRSASELRLSRGEQSLHLG